MGAERALVWRIPAVLGGEFELRSLQIFNECREPLMNTGTPTYIRSSPSSPTPTARCVMRECVRYAFDK